MLAHDQNFADVVAAQEELDRTEISEQGLDVTVVEDALQAETLFDGGVKRARRSLAYISPGFDVLHFENVIAHDMVAVAGRVRSSFASVEEGQQHASRLYGGPEARYHRLDQRLVHVVGQIPA